MSKTALISGIGGQDGSYLADILLAKGYEVHGLVRHSSCDNLWRLKHIKDKLNLHRGDVTDMRSVMGTVATVNPDELYHMADQDNVGWSFSVPGVQIDVTYGGVQNVLESVLQVKKECKVFIPVSATMFGNAPPPQNEDTPLDPRSPYACAKAAAYHLARHYRRDHSMFVTCGIMYNHDSPRRGPDYLLQKICRAAKLADINDPLIMGNLDLKVDIGYSPDYMDTAYKILQLDEPDDFVVSTEFGHPIRSMIAAAYLLNGVYDPVGKGYVIHGGDRPDQPVLVGDNSKLRELMSFNHRDSIDTIKWIMGEIYL